MRKNYSKSLWRLIQWGLSKEVLGLALSPHATEEIVYTTGGLNTYQVLMGRIEYAKLGLKHFRIRTIGNISDVEKEKADSYIERVLDAEPFHDGSNLWKALSEEGNALVESSRNLNSEPTFLLCRGLVATSDNHFARLIPIFKMP